MIVYTVTCVICMCNRVLGARQKSKSLTFSAGVPQVRDEVESKYLPGPKGGVALPLPGGRVSSAAAAHHDDVDHAELRMRAAPDATDGGGRPGDAAEEAGGQVGPLGRRMALRFGPRNNRPGIGPVGVAPAAASMTLPVSARGNRGRRRSRRRRRRTQRRGGRLKSRG